MNAILEHLSHPKKRVWTLFAFITLTLISSWSSISRLSQLVDEGKVPDDVANHSLLELAEQNIASHLHLSRRDDSGHRGGLTSADADITVRTTTKHIEHEDTGASTTHTTTITTGSCKAGKILPNTDFWGDALVWGSANKANTAEDCCKSCANYAPKNDDDGFNCNIWVWCGNKEICKDNYKECWLKHLAHPYGTAPVKEGPEVGWTTGIMDKDEDDKEAAAALVNDPNEDRSYHIVITAQGSAVHWQSRVHYYWFKKMKKKCEAAGKCDMGGFTRLLHSGEPDDLMNEIPTFVAQPLPPEHPDHGYIVLNRPYALFQWVQQAKIKEKYVIMGEPDHLWLKPMPNLMIGDRPAAFPFFYIEPSKKEYFPIIRKFLGPITRRDTEDIAPIGNSPTMMTFEDMKKVMPVWFNLSIAIHNDEEAVKEWGWVQEMYAFTLSCYKVGIKKIDLHLKMMSQPPWDTKLDPYYILHYTYGMDYTLEGKFTPGKFGEWRFDKRSYASLPPPRHLTEPPTGMTNELVRHLIHSINEASEVIPGWDEYAKTGVAKQLWDGVVRD